MLQQEKSNIQTRCWVTIWIYLPDNQTKVRFFSSVHSFPWFSLFGPKVAAALQRHLCPPFNSWSESKHPFPNKLKTKRFSPNFRTIRAAEVESVSCGAKLSHQRARCGGRRQVQSSYLKTLSNSIRLNFMYRLLPSGMSPGVLQKPKIGPLNKQQW